MRVSLIAAVAEDGVIGRGDSLPWRLPADFRWFRHHTMGHHLILGRRTWESIGRPLAERSIVVVSRGELDLPAGVVRAGSLDEAFTRAAEAGETDAFVGGGAEIYRQALGRADRLVLTRVLSEVEGDVRFPPWDRSRWRLTYRRERPADEENPLPMSFRIYSRIDSPGRQEPSDSSSSR